jgi:two-component system CheB/CheR fusion protein
VQALKHFFSIVPPDSGMAIVVILQLAPQYESNLPEVLQSSTRMPVTQVTEMVKIEPNRIYVTPPTQNLAMIDGHISLGKTARIGRALPRRARRDSARGIGT